MIPAPSADWSWLGRIGFDEAALLQENIREGVLRGECAETLLLCEHEPVITLGRRAQVRHVLLSEAELARRGVMIRRASRGGDVTYHGPGQLVGYPIFRLRRGVVGHIEAMAAGIVSLLGGYGVAADWRRDCPGVWVGAEKIAAFGVHVRRGVAIHGFALNLGEMLDAFSAIIPCGLRGTGVTSVSRLTGSAPAPEDCARDLVTAFERSFGRRLCEATNFVFRIANQNRQSIE